MSLIDTIKLAEPPLERRGYGSTASSSLAGLQTEAMELWASALVKGNWDDVERFAAESHALRRAERFRADPSSIG